MWKIFKIQLMLRTIHSMRRGLKALLLAGAVLTGAGLARPLSAVQPVALFSNWSCTDANPHIGSNIIFYTAMIQPGAQVSVSVTGSVAGPFGSVTLGSSAFATLPSQTLYVSDGNRAWSVSFVTGNNIVLNNTELVGGPATPLAVADYSALALQAFTAYTGTLIVGGVLVSGAPQAWASVAQITTALNDSGTGADFGAAGDGLWRGSFTVTDMDRIFQNAIVYGYGTDFGVSSDPVAGSSLINIDAQLPRIDQYNFSTNKVNYNGVLYLSALSQGTNVAQPTNALGSFSVTTNKNGTNVTVSIDTDQSGGVSPADKVLPPIAVGTNAINRTGAQTWIGDDGSGNYVPDGSYIVTMGINDSNGVQGVTVTTVVRVTSLRISIQDIVLSPSSLPTSPSFTDSIITRLSYKVVMDRENGGDLAPTLRLLRWFNAGVTNDLNEYITPGAGIPYFTNNDNTVMSLSEMEFLKPDGTTGIAFDSHDLNGAHDTDFDYLELFRGAAGSSAKGITYLLPDASTPDGVGETASPGAIVSVPDGNLGNDWDTVDSLFVTGGTHLAPTRLENNIGYSFRGATPLEGNYRLRLRTFITGLDETFGTIPSTPNIPDPRALSPTAPVFIGAPVHFMPSARPEGGLAGSFRGRGIYTEDTTATLVVSQTLPPTGDTSPPYVLSSNPTASSVVLGSSFDKTHAISVIVRDDESPVSSDRRISSLVLKDPSGNIVQGTSATDGGSPTNQMTIYFYPQNALSIAGNYTLEVNACSVNCMPDTKIPFTVMDVGAPQILGVELTSLSDGIQPLLTNNTSFQGPFNYSSEIAVRLGMGAGTTNTPDWQDSSVQAFEIVGGVAVPYLDFIRVSPLTSTATAPSDQMLHYRFGTPINRNDQFELHISAVSKNANGDFFTNAFVGPRFATQLSTNGLGVYYPFTTTYGLVAPMPLTLTSGGVWITPTAATISLTQPNFGLTGVPTGFKPLSNTASAASTWQLMVAGLGTVSSKLKFLYNASLVPSIILGYDDADIPSGVSEGSLVVYAYDGSWQQVTTNIQAKQSGTTANTFTITPPNGTDSPWAYAIFYPDTSTFISGPTPTPVAFKSTRSFNPIHANAVFRKARFYYGSKPPKEVEVRIFDANGTLVRQLSLGNGVNATDLATDPVYGNSAYFFEWDGRNDAGTLVRNGIYLARWRVTFTDNTTDTAVKPVALIK
jgi:hypothetical protein